MNAIGYEQDTTQIILSQLRLEQSQSTAGVPKPPHAYIQVEYMTRKVFKMNPEEAEQYERSLEQENMRQYLEQAKNDKKRQELIKHNLKHKFFKLRQLKPINLKKYTLQEEPIEMLKSFSQPTDFHSKKSLPASIIESHPSLSLSSARTKVDQKSRYAQSFQQLLDQSQKLTQNKSRYRLVGGTMIQKEKINQQIMRSERKEILNIISGRNYSQNRPKKLDEISNKEKYNLGYLDYMRSKTKLSLDKSLFEKKIRKIEGKLQNFQQFVLREGKMKEGARGKLQKLYIKMREQFRRIERSNSPKRKQNRQLQ